ncbi:DUF1232 domain-containing protein [Candidatus Dojkabacteria bacterium]|nr:DUF1232 domain-containing protein [Candidatus Dojkabacteria bacterium]
MWRFNHRHDNMYLIVMEYIGKMKIKNFLKENWLLIVAIIYLIWPLDIIPDFTPFVGQTDDSVLFAIELFRRWYNQRKNT